MSTKDLEILSDIMDTKFKGPFGFRFGLDGIIGVIPGVGDFITATVSFYIVFRAALIKCPVSLILRMCLNILIENIVGLIPVVGDIFDFAWKSNHKNLQLLKSYDIQPQRTRQASSLLVFSVILATVLIMIGLFVGSVILVQQLIEWLQQVL